jgi:hypothetical protein
LPLSIVPNPLLECTECHMRSSEGLEPQKKPAWPSQVLPYRSVPLTGTDESGVATMTSPRCASPEASSSSLVSKR